MPAGVGAFEAIGWIFSAQDLASSVAVNAASTINAAGVGIEMALGGAADAVTISTQAIAQVVGKSVEVIGASFEGVFGDAADTALSIGRAGIDALGSGLTNTFDSGINTLDRFATGATASLTRFTETFAVATGSVIEGGINAIDRFGKAGVESFNNLIEFGGKVKTLVFDTQLSFKNLGGVVTSVAGVMQEGLSGFADVTLAAMGASMVTIAGVGAKAAARIFEMGQAGAGAAVKMGGLLSTMLGMNEANASGAGGGGGFLGPFAKLGALLGPIINLLSTTFAPLIEGIMVHVQNALGPLQMAMEMIAQDLGPKIAALLIPLVGVLEIVVAQVGGLLSSLLDTGPALGGVTQIAGMFGEAVQSLMPSLLLVVEALMGVVSQILPVVLSLIQQLLPIATELITLVADLVAELLPQIGEMWAEIGPLLVTTVISLLRAVMPLVPPILKLVSVLTSKVFLPLLVKSLTMILELIQAVAPYIESFAYTAGGVITIISERVDEFFSNFSRYMNTFYVLFIQPIVDGIMDIVNAVFVGNSPSLKDAILFIPNAFKEGADIAAAAILAIPNAIKTLVFAIFDWLKAAVKLYVRFVKAYWDFIVGIPQFVLGLLRRIRTTVLDPFFKFIPLKIEEIGTRIFNFFMVDIPGYWTSFWSWLQGTAIGALQWLSDTIGPIMEALGLGDIGAEIQGALGAAIAALSAPIETMRRLINRHVIDVVNTLLTFDLPAIGALSEIIPGVSTIPRLAAGGVTTGATFAEIGEAGPEMVLPLRSDVIEAVLAPVLPDLGIDRILDMLTSIDRKLGGVLRVDSAAVLPRQNRSANEPSLLDAIGIAGVT